MLVASYAGAQPSHALPRPLVYQQDSTDNWSTGNFDRLEGLVIRRLEFSGNTFTKDKVVRRAASSLREGDLFTVRALDQSLKRLNKLGRFEKVTEQNVEWRVNQSSREVDFIIRVKEQPRRK
jgi:outer membrane protein assembly factor BamA